MFILQITELNNIGEPFQVNERMLLPIYTFPTEKCLPFARTYVTPSADIFLFVKFYSARLKKLTNRI